MALADILFGSAPKAKISSLSTLTSEQENALRDILGLLPADVAAGQQIAAGGTTGLSAAQRAVLGILQRDATDIEDFFQTNIAGPLLEQFERDILPGIARGSVGRTGSGLSGERLEQENRAREDLIEALARGRSDVALRGREIDTQAILGAAGIGGQLSSTQLGARSARVDELLRAIFGQAKENIATVTGGSAGLVGPALQGFSAGIGSAAGAKIF